MEQRENPKRKRRQRGQAVEAPKELNLPGGWLYEERPRDNPKYQGRVDKFYYEPGTGRQFRTYRDVLRYFEFQKAQQRRLANDMKFKSLIEAKKAARDLASSSTKEGEVEQNANPVNYELARSSDTEGEVEPNVN